MVGQDCTCPCYVGLLHPSVFEAAIATRQLTNIRDSENNPLPISYFLYKSTTIAFSNIRYQGVSTTSRISNYSEDLNFLNLILL
jgi:hypothetical protein